MILKNKYKILFMKPRFVDYKVKIVTLAMTIKFRMNFCEIEN
jgi:hypothetical protein